MVREKQRKGWRCEEKDRFLEAFEVGSGAPEAHWYPCSPWVGSSTLLLFEMSAKMPYLDPKLFLKRYHPIHLFVPKLV